MNEDSSKQMNKDSEEMNEDSSEQMNKDNEELKKDEKQMNEESEEDFCYASQFSPEGLLPQVEYATEATLKSPTAIGMKGYDGFVLAAEKCPTKLLTDATENRNIFAIDQHIGAVAAGLMPDARRIINEARTLASNYRLSYASPAPLNHLIQNISAYVHENTLHINRRPFAASLIIGSYLQGDGPKLYCVEPSGGFEGYNGCAIGKAAEEAKSEMKEIDFSNTSISELVKEATRIMYIVHDNEGDFELELSWCGEITDGLHVTVPTDVLQKAKGYTKKQNGNSNSNNI